MDVHLLQPFQPLGSGRQEDGRMMSYEPIDTTKALDIVEEEELERISGLLQRDNLVRGLGIVEHVYRLLHCTPGTMSLQTKADHGRTHQVCNIHLCHITV